jgi:hypothetical protein
MTPEKHAAMMIGQKAYWERQEANRDFAERMPNTHCKECGRGLTLWKSLYYCRKCERTPQSWIETNTI